MFSLEVCFEQSFCERGECFRWLPYPITMLSPVYQRACLPAEGSRHVLGRTLLSKRVWNCGCRCERELCWVKLPWTITGNNNININETCCIGGTFLEYLEIFLLNTMLQSSNRCRVSSESTWKNLWDSHLTFESFRTDCRRRGGAALKTSYMTAGTFAQPELLTFE